MIQQKVGHFTCLNRYLRLCLHVDTTGLATRSYYNREDKSSQSGVKLECVADPLLAAVAQCT